MSTLEESLDPESTVEIQDPNEFDAINDPLRWRLWSQLQRPLTVRQLGDAVGVAPGRLYYHLDRLARHGWVEVAEERPSRTRPERVWRSRRSGYRLSGAAKNAAQGGGATGASLGLLDDAGHDLGPAALVEGEVEHSLELVVRGAGFLDAEKSAELKRDLLELGRRYFPEDDRGLPRPPQVEDGSTFTRFAATVANWR
jgi:DNA-binding transcriptional ArsR family regulator